MRVEELVGQRIAELRERIGMTQAQLGEHLGELLDKPWPRQTVSIAEKGGRRLTATELYAVAYVLDVYIGQLFVPPHDLDAVEFPSGKKMDGAWLRSTQPYPRDPQGLIPLVYENVAKLANVLAKRRGEDMVLEDDLKKIRDMISNSLPGHTAGE